MLQETFVMMQRISIHGFSEKRNKQHTNILLKSFQYSQNLNTFGLVCRCVVQVIFDENYIWDQCDPEHNKQTKFVEKMLSQKFIGGLKVQLPN